jgi:hypothetical protein
VLDVAEWLDGRLNAFLLRQQIKRELEHLLRNAVDLVFKNGPVTAFMRMAKRDGIPL